MIWHPGAMCAHFNIKKQGSGAPGRDATRGVLEAEARNGKGKRGRELVISYPFGPGVGRLFTRSGGGGGCVCVCFFLPRRQIIARLSISEERARDYNMVLREF